MTEENRTPEELTRNEHDHSVDWDSVAPRHLDSYMAGDVVEEMIAALDRRRQRNKRVGLRYFGSAFLVGILLALIAGSTRLWLVAAIDVTVCVVCWVLSFILWKEE